MSRAADEMEVILAAVARPKRRRLVVVMTRRGRYRHLLEVVDHVATRVLCGVHGDATRTRKYLTKGNGTIYAPDCPTCAGVLRRRH